MKKHYRLLCVLIALVMLVSCTNGNGTTEESTSPETNPIEESGVLIVRRGIPQYSIVYATGMASKYVDLVIYLQETIKEYTGVTVTVREESDTRDENAKEILIGVTKYEATKTVKRKLAKNGFAICTEGDKIVVLGDHNDALEEALYYMIDVLIPKNTKVLQGKSTLYHEDYDGKYVEPQEILFNGIPISEFSVVYSKDVPEMEQLATDLATRIGSAFKTTVDCYSDEKPERQHEILVGLTNRPLSVECFADSQVPLMTYRLVVQGDTVQFACPGAHSGNELLTLFYNSYILGTSYKNLRNGIHMEKNLLTVTNQPLTEGSTLRIMTSNILADRWVTNRNNYGSVAKRAELYAAMLMVYRPALIGVQETDEPWFENLPYYLDYLRDYLYLDYKWVENIYPYNHDNPPTKGIPTYTSIIYSRDQFTYVESGMEEFTDGYHTIYKLRVMTYVILTHKESGEKYALVNTHYDGTPTIAAREIAEQASLVNRLKNKYSGIRLFCTGDYNNHGGYNISDLKKALNMLTTKEMAKTNGTLVNELPGIPEGIYIDHIFAEKTVTVTRHETIDVNFANLLSDHRLQYADVIVN